MTHRLTSNCAKNYCNRTLIVKVIVENVVTCFLGGHGVVVVLRPKFNVAYVVLSVSFHVRRGTKLFCAVFSHSRVDR